MLFLVYTEIGSVRGHWWEIYSGQFFFELSVIAGFGLVARLERAVLVAGAVAVLMNGAGMLRALDAHRTADFYGAHYELYARIGRWVADHLPADAKVGAAEVGIVGSWGTSRTGSSWTCTGW